MTHPYWPPFDLEVRTPRLTLRGVDDELALEIVEVAARGVHDPAMMPFLIPWTDAEPPDLQRDALRFFWRTRAECRPEAWNLIHAVIVDGAAIGVCDVGGTDFGRLGEIVTGSWLGLEFHGQGLGKELRMAALTLGFDGFGAEYARTSAWQDNAPSLGVTRSLGYREEGRRRAIRRDSVDELIGYRMHRDHWRTIRRDDITLHGVDAVRDLLSISPTG